MISVGGSITFSAASNGAFPLADDSASTAKRASCCAAAAASFSFGSVVSSGAPDSSMLAWVVTAPVLPATGWDLPMFNGFQFSADGFRLDDVRNALSEVGVQGMTVIGSREMGRTRSSTVRSIDSRTASRRSPNIASITP